jgi:hypothetical protein
MRKSHILNKIKHVNDILENGNDYLLDKQGVSHSLIVSTLGLPLKGL